MTMSFTETVIYDLVVQVKLLDVDVFVRVKRQTRDNQCNFVLGYYDSLYLFILSNSLVIIHYCQE